MSIPFAAGARWLTALVLACALAPAAALAQETPEQVATRYFEAMRAQQWQSAAELMHPSALEAFQRGLLRLTTVVKEDSILVQAIGMTAAEIQAGTPAGVFARFTAHQMSRDPELAASMAAATYRTLGVAAAGDTAHVDYEMALTVDDEAMTVPGRISLLQHGSAWRALLAGDVQVLIDRIEVMAEGEL